MSTGITTGWDEATARAASSGRTLVLGPTDVGKSTFIGALAARHGNMGLIDLDPGQKMIGPPGTASLGHLGSFEGASRLDRFIFLGSTSAGNLSGLIRAAEALASEASEPFVVNSSGFVRGLGARLQTVTAAVIRPNLIVAMGDPAELAPILEAHVSIPTILLPVSPLARRKSPSFRTSIRQAAFDEALRGAREVTLENASVAVEPAMPPMLAGAARPVCSLADANGTDMCIGIVEAANGERLSVHAHPPPRPVRRVRLDKMWAERTRQGWRLLERLTQAWAEPA